MTRNKTPLARRLAARPLALAPRAIDAIMAPPGAMIGGETARAQRAAAWNLTSGGIAVLPIFGPLLQRGDAFTLWLGAMTYDDIDEAVGEAFADSGVRAVLLEIDSPGGEVAGLFDLVDHLGALKSTHGKPLWAIAREQALSAAYAIASVADRIYVTQTGEAGSVGVLAVHVDRSAHDKIGGETYSLIHAGAKKTDGNPHIPLSASATADIQADVDDLYTRFVTGVARARHTTPQAVSATEAAIYRGQRAMDAGFADRIGTLETAHADLVTALDQPLAPHPASNPTAKILNQSTERTMTMTTKPELAMPAAAATEPGTGTPAAAIPVPRAAIDPASPPVSAPDARAETADSIRAEAAEIAKIGAAAAKLGLTIDVPAALTAGTRPDALRRAVLEQLAATTDATIIASIAPRVVDAAPMESGLVAAAKEAAAKTA